jgi:ABC-type nitrate/sulfonate/bicarbonate transport system substrate-binding protein
MFIAREGGYYANHGLEVELSFAPATAGLAMITNGDAQMTNSSMEQALLASAIDGSFVMVGSSLNRGLFALMGLPGLSTVDDLRGRRIGVSQIGDAPYNYTVALLDKFGLTATDVQWIPVGPGAPTRATSLASERVDATLLTAPAFFALEDEGFVKLADLTEHDDIYASTVYLMTKGEISADPQLPVALIKAHAESIARFYSDRDFAIEAYLAYDGEQSAPDVARVYDRFADAQALERIPYVMDLAVRSILGQANAQDSPQIVDFEFGTVIDNSIVDRLVEEGFFVETFGPDVAAEQDRKRQAAFRSGGF